MRTRYVLQVFHRIFILFMFLACSSDNGANRPVSTQPFSEPGSDPQQGNAGNSPESNCVWQELASAAIERLESQTALIGSKLYTFSGFTHNLVISADTEIYDLQTSSWSSGAPMPIPVTHMGAATLNGKVWIAGGFVGDHPGEATAVVQVYDALTDTWEEGPELPSARASGALVNLGGALHYFGGLMPDRQTDLDEHLVFDPQNPSAGWEERAALPDGRNHLGGVVLNGKIYAVGGQFGHDGARDDIRLVHVYHPEADRWEELSGLPVDLSHFEPGIFTWKERIFVVGGRSDDVFGNKVLVYDPATDTWEEFCDLPDPLLAPVSGIYNNRLYLLNGGVEGVCCPVANFRFIDIE